MTDPRPQLAASLDQTERQIAAIDASDLDRPTPCGDYDVRTLLAHLIAVLRKIEAVGRGEDMTTFADPADDIADDHAAAFRQAHVALERTWSADALLDRTCTLAWGEMVGRDVLDAYAHEFAGHAWDLAPVAGGLDELDPELGEAALAWYRKNVSPEERSTDGPFAPVVEVDDDAHVYERLAGYLGRDVAR